MKRMLSVLICLLLLPYPAALAAEDMPSVLCAELLSPTAETAVTLAAAGGRSCYFLENEEKKLALRADGDAVAAETENLLLRIVYLDDGAGFLRVRWRARSSQLVVRTRLIHKSSRGGFREAAVLINRGLYDGGGDFGADIIIDSYDTHKGVCRDYISEIELINLDEMGSNEENGKKRHIFFGASAEILDRLGLLPPGNAEEMATLYDINSYFTKITGISADVTGSTMQQVITSWLTALGYPTDGNLQNKAVSAGLIRAVSYAPSFFGRSGYEMQNFGVGTVTYTSSQTVFYDDLAGLLYGLLFVKKNGDPLPCLAQLMQADNAFAERLFRLNDTLLSNAYYDAAGIEISEKTVTDSLTGNELTCLYMRGGNVNSTSVNELASLDGENYLLCAAYDKRQDLGVPVIYNRKTKKTTELSQTRNMDSFGMLLSRDNTAYFTEGASLYSYSIASGEKKTVFTEPDGDALQEVPTITNDGKYITVFCGKLVSYQPNVIYRISLTDGSYTVIINEAWTAEHFSGSVNPHLGHVIINPENPDIINFMHGGGANVADRLWLYENGEIYQPYVQQIKENGAFGEHITHAFWSSDGSRLYFLRPPASSDSVENGIAYIDITEENKTVHVLNGDYSYIHTSVDEDGRHFISDTQLVYDRGSYRNEIALYSDISKSAALLAYVPVWNAHPCHSHPTFTADGKGVVFNLADEENGNCMVAAVNVEEILPRLDRGEYNRNGAIAWLNAGSSSGMMGINLTDDMRQSTNRVMHIGITEDSLGFEVFGSFVPKNESTVTLLLTYLDKGSDSFYIRYNTNSESVYASVKNRKQLAVEKTNTDKWKTVTLVLEDASFRSANADNSDFTIARGEKTPIRIRELAVFSGSSEKAEYSAPVKDGGKSRIPIINPQAEARELMVVGCGGGEYYMTELTVAGGGFGTAELLQADLGKIFVWDKNLCPLNRRDRP